ncbi:siroheme synthase CysG [Chelativorans sp. YIM 93263]|uniref:siroheme synthase CysG n=1 Tax=Chelativorans sp. YIM 93263 TaxID=2906648 RepID=UPI002378D15C|nr:siroheme synthase CysG [Chelativorans sp. YIM 93263]
MPIALKRPPSETAPPRMARLSVLPVFFELDGKPVLVAGGTDAAAWKAELLVAAGARVHVFSTSGEIGDEMKRLAGHPNGRVVHYRRKWSGETFDGMALAIADAADGAEAARFATAAVRAGVPCNVIDRPDFCSFQFGSIVNRSPLVVGISTSGAAPILGQAVRRRIETLLPSWLSGWAALAQRLRPQVLDRLAPGRQRRAFWEALVDRAFAGPAGDAEAVQAERIVDEIVSNEAGETGHVTFAGAGPGEAELLTIKAARALQAADVILFDDLVCDEVLEFARREARRICVGKRAGRPSCRQHDISALMVRLAGEGKRVVRLKSGDPMIFGRAGEEIAALQAHGISFDVVPGITAGLALAAAAGISLTHRDHARFACFVTGHSKNGGLPEDLDWARMADPRATTIFYMGARTAGRIAVRLMAHGLSGETSAVVAAAIGRPGQRIRYCRLHDLGNVVAPEDTREPVLIGVGKMFEAAEEARAEKAYA